MGAAARKSVGAARRRRRRADEEFAARRRDSQHRLHSCLPVLLSLPTLGRCVVERTPATPPPATASPTPRAAASSRRSCSRRACKLRANSAATPPSVVTHHSSPPPPLPTAAPSSPFDLVRARAAFAARASHGAGRAPPPKRCSWAARRRDRASWRAGAQFGARRFTASAAARARRWSLTPQRRTRPRFRRSTAASFNREPVVGIGGASPAEARAFANVGDAAHPVGTTLRWGRRRRYLPTRRGKVGARRAGGRRSLTSTCRPLGKR